MRRWLDRHWYRYLWRRIGPDGRMLLGLLAAAVVGLGGFFTVRAMASTPDAQTASYVQLMTTVTKTVHTRENGRIVVKRVPVVRRIYAKPVTVQETRTVETAGGTKVVTRPVVSYRPVYRKKIVTIHGKPVTIKQIVTNTRMLTDTQRLTVTNERTSTLVQQVAATSTVVQNRTQTVHQTVNQTVTAVRTETAPPVTVTEPGGTVTETVVTTAPPETVTVTEPGITVTVGLGDG